MNVIDFCFFKRTGRITLYLSPEAIKHARAIERMLEEMQRFENAKSVMHGSYDLPSDVEAK